MTRSIKGLYPTEQQEGESFATWLNVRRFDFTHIPNETGGDPAAKRRAVRMKRAGVSKGFPDYLIFANGKKIAIELKRVKEAKPAVQPEQRNWLQTLAKYGFECAICYGRDECVEFVNSVLNPKAKNPKPIVDDEPF